MEKEVVQSGVVIGYTKVDENGQAWYRLADQKGAWTTLKGWSTHEHAEEGLRHALRSLEKGSKGVVLSHTACQKLKNKPITGR